MMSDAISHAVLLGIVIAVFVVGGIVIENKLCGTSLDLLKENDIFDEVRSPYW